MRLVAVHRVDDGMELARDVTTGRPHEAPLLRRGVRLTARLALRLAEKGVHAIWIHDGLGEGIEPVAPLSEPVREEAERETAAALEHAQTPLSHGQPIAAGLLDNLAGVAAAIAADVAGCAPAALALADLATADAYTHTHALRVTTLGLLMGHRSFSEEGWTDWQGRRRYDHLEERLTLLGQGLLLHDIGKLAIPAEILNKPGPLTAAEYEIVQTHPEAGASMLPPHSISPLVRAVVLWHHERWDGYGYPHGKAGTDVHPFARLAACADVYDAVTSARPYQAPAPPHVAVRVVVNGARSQFDPEMVEIFRKVVMPFPLGYEVRLPDGRRGVVAAVDPDDPERPVVRAESFERDDAYEEFTVDFSHIATAA